MGRKNITMKPKLKIGDLVIRHNGISTGLVIDIMRHSAALRGGLTTPKDPYVYFVKWINKPYKNCHNYWFAYELEKVNDNETKI